jgi:hypothetical protein
MTQQNRREFLKKLAKTAVYAAPVVHTLAAPIDLVGQGQSTGHKPPGHSAAFQPQQQPTTDPQPPWQQPPPGTTPPGSDPGTIKRQ